MLNAVHTEPEKIMSTIGSVLWSRAFALAMAVPLALVVLPARAQERIILDGSTGMLPLARALVSAYRQQVPDAQIEVGIGLGTGARLQALVEGKIQIALASHGIKPEDVRAGDLRVFEAAKGAVVFAVNETVPISNVSETQACEVYGGKIESWRPLGGSDSLVTVLTRPPAEVDPEVIRAKIDCFKDLKEVTTAKVMPRGGDMAKALAETPHALGMTSMTVVEQSGGKVKALSLNGVAPTIANVKSGRYFLTRDFLFVVKGEPVGSTRKFLDFLLSPDGDRVILANGAVPLR